MHFTGALVIAVAGLAAAQSSTTSAAAASSSGVTGCGDALDATISACLQSTSIPLNNCATNDWRCYCKAQQSIVTCWNACPQNPGATTAKQTETSWCNAAKIQPQSSSTTYSQAKTTKSQTSSSAGSMTKTHGGATTGFAQPSGSASASGAAATTSNAAFAITPAGGLAAAIFGGLALL